MATMANYITNLPEALIEIIYNFKDDIEFNDKIESYKKRMEITYEAYYQAADGFGDIGNAYGQACIEAEEDPMWDSEGAEEFCRTNTSASRTPWSRPKYIYGSKWFVAWEMFHTAMDKIHNAWKLCMKTANSYHDILVSHDRYNSYTTYGNDRWTLAKMNVKYSNFELYGILHGGKVTTENINIEIKRMWDYEKKWNKNTRCL